MQGKCKVSTYAQDLTCHTKKQRNLTVRAAFVRAPIDLLLLDDHKIRARFRRDMGGVTLPKFAETQISLETYLDVFDRVRFLSQGAEPFLRAGLRSDLSTIGVFGKAVICAPTVWDAIAQTQEGLRYCQPSAQTTVNLKRGRCQIVFHAGKGRGPGQAANIQYVTALYVYLLRNAAKPVDLDLRLTYPGATASHFAIFPEAVNLRSGPFGVLDFDEALLRSPMASCDTRKWLVARRVLASFEAKNLKPEDLPDMIKTMQRASLSSSNSPMTLQATGELLDLPIRTVQAHLKSANTSFASVRNEVLHDLACNALASGRTISETSAMLGFSQRQSFSEAFSKWEGQPPSEFASQGQKRCAVG